MTRRTAAILGTVVLTIALAAFTGSALAGNGHGNDSQTPAAQPGNSGNAPGQQQSDNASTHSNASSHANTTTHPKSHAISANSSAGVKPSKLDAAQLLGAGDLELDQAVRERDDRGTDRGAKRIHGRSLEPG